MKVSVCAWFMFMIVITTSLMFCQTTNLFADVDDPLELTDDDYSKDRIARLIQLLDDKEPQVRGEAAENLSLLGSEAREAIPKMLTLMDDKGRYSVASIPCVVGGTAASSLVTMAPESILPLQQRFTTLSSDAQWKVVSQITNVKANVSPLIPQLIQML
jgi:HEAT repeat protein